LDNWAVNAGASGDIPFVAADDTLNGGLSPHSGSWVAYLGDSTAGGYATSTLDLVINLAGETSVQLDFYWATFGLEPDHFIYLDLYDGTWHTDILHYQGTDWETHAIDLDADYAMIDGFIVRFRSYLDYVEGSDATYIDDVCVRDPTIPTPTASPVPSGKYGMSLTITIFLTLSMIFLLINNNRLKT
jgi:hypothetical protein